MVSRSGWAESLRKRKKIVLASLAALCTLMLAVGVYFEQYFMVFTFCIWLCAEALLLRLHTLLTKPARAKLFFGEYLFPEKEEDKLWALYSEASENSYTLLGLKISERLNGSLSEEEKNQTKHLRTLSTLKLLLNCSTQLRGKLKLQQCFVYQRGAPHGFSPGIKLQNELASIGIQTTQDICEAAVSVADLLLRTQKIAESASGRMGKEARALIERVLAVPFEPVHSRKFIDNLTDATQKSSGVPFLILNLLHAKQVSLAREISKALLSGELEVDDELKSTLYWIAEVDWFSHDKKDEVLEHDSAIRYLYHLCFTNPDRAGFLEIDSQFGGEFGPVNEIVEEGFLFKESLVEALLETWENYEGWFDGIFQNCLEAMTGRKSKIYDERANWLRFWRQEKDQFSREYLYVVEGNLCFASEQFEDAKFCYQKALEIAPKLRSALFNLMFVSAKLKDKRTHELAKSQILKVTEWMPLALTSIANSYFLLGDENSAFEFYEMLRNEKGWERKVDFYISMFCFEQKWYDKALAHAIKAHDVNAADSSVSFHLSRCYSTVGQKDAALEVFKMAQGDKIHERLASHADWMNYYRFTLERDSGRAEDAVRTLLKIPRDYFQDDEELNAALQFAKDRKDLVLLRHLKQ